MDESTDEIEQLRGNLSLAEDGLAAAMQEIERRDRQLKESVDHEVDYQRQIERLRALLGEKRTWCDAPLPGRPYPEYACGQCWSCRVRAELIGPAHEPRELHAKGCPCPTCLNGATRSNIEQQGLPLKSSEHHCPTCACPDMRRAGFIK